MLKRLGRFFRELLFPPKCVSCGVFLKKDVLDPVTGVFCDSCGRAWRRLHFERCGTCGLEYARCRCKPKLLRDLGVLDAVKLIPYERVRETVGKKSILFMKKRNSGALFRFLGKELATALTERLRDSGKEKARILVTYLPRGRRGVNRYGFDQSRLLAREAARELGAEFLSVFRRKFAPFSREQKHLGAKKRKRNMQSAFRLRKKGKRTIETCDFLVIVDDVVTTGASLAGCLSLLDKQMRAKTICLTVGVTPSPKKRIK